MCCTHASADMLLRVVQVCRHLHTQYGIDITYLGVDQHGMVDMEELKRALTDKAWRWEHVAPG